MDILTTLAEYGIGFLLLGVAVFYMEKRVTKKETELEKLRAEKDTEIKRLNVFIHDEAKETLKFLGEVNQVLNKVIEASGSVESNVIQAIKLKLEQLKSELTQKITELASGK